MWLQGECSKGVQLFDSLFTRVCIVPVHDEQRYTCWCITCIGIDYANMLAWVVAGVCEFECLGYLVMAWVVAGVCEFECLGYLVLQEEHHAIVLPAGRCRLIRHY